MVRNCSLKNCSNSVNKKYHFFVLPSPSKVAKRAAWLKNCGHLLPENISNHRHLALCEGHFEVDQFYCFGPNRRDKLKPTAIPTIFVKNPPRIADRIKSEEESWRKTFEKKDYAESDIRISPDDTRNSNSISMRLHGTKGSSCNENLIVADPLASGPVFDSQENTKYCRTSADMFDLRKKVHDLRLERDAALRKYQVLALKIETMETNLRLFLNHDQVRILESENPCTNSTCWSPDTLRRCSKLLASIGLRSYEYLRVEEHYPLPSYRTLNRHQIVSKPDRTINDIPEKCMDETIDKLTTAKEEYESELDNESDEVDIHEHTDFEILETDYEDDGNFEYVKDEPIEEAVDLLEKSEALAKTGIMEYSEEDFLEMDFYAE